MNVYNNYCLFMFGIIGNKVSNIDKYRMFVLTNEEND